MPAGSIACEALLATPNDALCGSGNGARSLSQPAQQPRRRVFSGKHARLGASILAGDVRAPLRAEATALLDRTGSALPLHERAAPRGPCAPALWRAGRRRLRAAHRRRRCRQDHRVPLLPRATARALQRRLHLQPEADGRGTVEDGLRGAPHPVPARGARRADRQGLRRRAERVPAAHACCAADHRTDHRRSAEPVGPRAGAAATSDQPRDQ